MNLNDRLTLGAIDLPDYATNGAIGPSSLVSNYSSININQTTANVSLKLPTPTAGINGQLLYIGNIGTVSINIGGVSIAANTATYFKWSGAAWLLDAGTLAATPSWALLGNGEVDGEQVDDFLRYEGHALPFVLVNAIKELYNEVQRLTARLVQLEA